MQNTVGHRETERALQLGLLYPAEQALNVGLVDELVPLEKVTETAEHQLQAWLKIPG
jgi:3,2-trans-enoyl-CoA isomerase